MSFEDKSEKEKLNMFVQAFNKAGCRAIIQGFQKTLQDYELPDTMMACGSVPHILDQMGFAKQLNDINVATKPLPSKNLSEQSIYEAIMEMKSSYDEKKKNAETISNKIKSEGGVKEAVRLIENLQKGSIQ